MHVADLLEIGALPSAAHRPWPPPRGPWVMTQTWDRLLFAHWPLPVDVLRPLVPSSLTLETFEGRAWLGITPFTLSALRPRATPAIPGLAPFHEINVRTYVRVADRPGVFFFSLDASNPLAVAGARIVYSLPYVRSRFAVTSAGQPVVYRSRRVDRRAARAVFEARYRPAGPVVTASPGTLAHWLTERYCLYAVSRRGGLRRAEIHHLPWPLQAADAEIGANTMTVGLGVELPRTPPIVHFSEHLDVYVWLPTRVTRSESATG
jgi:uncharacterized protein